MCLCFNSLSLSAHNIIVIIILFTLPSSPRFLLGAWCLLCYSSLWLFVLLLPQDIAPLALWAQAQLPCALSDFSVHDEAELGMSIAMGQWHCGQHVICLRPPSLSSLNLDSRDFCSFSEPGETSWSFQNHFLMFALLLLWVHSTQKLSPV